MPFTDRPTESVVQEVGFLWPPAASCGLLRLPPRNRSIWTKKSPTEQSDGNYPFTRSMHVSSASPQPSTLMTSLERQCDPVSKPLPPCPFPATSNLPASPPCRAPSSAAVLGSPLQRLGFPDDHPMDQRLCSSLGRLQIHLRQEFGRLSLTTSSWLLQSGITQARMPASSTTSRRRMLPPLAHK